MLVSIIIPVYNSEKYILSTVKSVLDQTYKDFEVIIIDDGSTDNTRTILESLKDSRIKYFYQMNSGVAVARNEGIKKAKGEYIAFLDSDDKWEPDKLKIQLDSLSKAKDTCMIYTAFEMYYENHNKTKIYKYNHDENNFIKKLLIDPFKSIPYPSTVMIKKSYLDNAGEFNTDFPTGEDWDLWLRLCKLGKCKYIDQSLVKKLTHSESITNSLDLEETGKYHFKLLNKFFANNPEYKKHKAKAFSMIYYDLACRYYGRNNFMPTQKLYSNLLKSIITYPPLYFARPKMSFVFNTLIKDNLKFLSSIP